MPVTVIGPGDTKRVTFQPLLKCMKRDTLQRILSGDYALRVVGEITYDDVFGDSHATPVKFRWKNEVSGFIEES